MIYRFLLCVLLFSQSILYSEIYDCFIFFNELDLLEIRLNELYHSVDRFVIVESVETFTGMQKPLYFKENQARYSRFLDKVIYIPLMERQNVPSAWDREAFQRNQILRGLKGCHKDDIIMVSDVDEIPKDVAWIKQEVLKCPFAIVCDQNLYRFFLNQFDYNIFPWPGTFALKFGKIKKRTLNQLRLQRHHFPHLPNAGWHFSSQGGMQNWIKKIESFSHTERDVAENKNMQHIRSYLDQNCRRVLIDATYPKFIRENLQYYIDNGFVDP